MTQPTAPYTFLNRVVDIVSDILEIFRFDGFARQPVAVSSNLSYTKS